MKEHPDYIAVADRVCPCSGCPRRGKGVRWKRFKGVWMCRACKYHAARYGLSDEKPHDHSDMTETELAIDNLKQARRKRPCACGDCPLKATVVTKKCKDGKCRCKACYSYYLTRSSAPHDHSKMRADGRYRAEKKETSQRRCACKGCPRTGREVVCQGSDGKWRCPGCNAWWKKSENPSDVHDHSFIPGLKEDINQRQCACKGCPRTMEEAKPKL
ncbi:hypothetical protein BJX66DRAFT_319062 [Aspergillus keveii]|uniref:Uncharacterized protein n=1 Tax=Aspergillus keveii TaxID=714993 RepID=A0ABR4FIR6_9EURO